MSVYDTPQCEQVLLHAGTFYFCTLRGNDHEEHMNDEYGVWLVPVQGPEVPT